MTQQNNESGSGSVSIFDIVLSLIAVASPFVWVWTTEVALVSHDMHGLIFFVWAISGVAGYHVTMYVMFVSVCFDSFQRREQNSYNAASHRRFAEGS